MGELERRHHPHGPDGGLGRPDARDAVADNEGEEDEPADIEALSHGMMRAAAIRAGEPELADRYIEHAQRADAKHEPIDALAMGEAALQYEDRRFGKSVLDVLIERAVDEGAFADFYKAKRIITKLLEGERDRAYRDAARIVMENRGRDAEGRDEAEYRRSVAGMADRILGRAQGLGVPGKGRLPAESTTDHAIWLSSGVESR